jgi:hypothetical protein
VASIGKIQKTLNTFPLVRAHFKRYFPFLPRFLYNPLLRMGKPNLVGAFHLGGWANRIRLELPTLADGQTEFGWSFPLWRMGKPNLVGASHFGGFARIRSGL